MLIMKMCHQLVGFLQMNLYHLHGIKQLNYGIWIHYNQHKLLFVFISIEISSITEMILHRFRNVEKLFYLLTYHQSMVYYFVVLLIDLFVFMIHVFKVCFLFNQIKSNLFSVICRRICSSINIFLS